jgi:RHS repeat-associated protein
MVRSGPALETEVLESLMAYTLDEAEARREVETLYEPFSGRTLERRFGGGGEYGAGDEEHVIGFEYFSVDGPNLAPWPYRVVNSERVPEEPNLVETSWTRYVQRDPWGRPVLTEGSNGSTVTTSYDRTGDVIRTLTGAGAMQAFIYDGRGLLVRHLRPNGRGATAYGYDASGKLGVRAEQAMGAEGWEDLWRTEYAWDSAGRSDRVDYPDGSFESFGYNSDHTVDTHQARDGITVTYSYDPANRVTLAAPSGSVPATMIELDAGDSFAYDALSRITFANRSPDPMAETSMRVETTGFDLGGRPGAEVVGARSPLEWTFDSWDRPETVTIPMGVGRGAGSFTGFERQWDTLDRVAGIGGIGMPELGADWTWGGAGRLYGITSRGPLATAVRLGYVGGAGPQLPGESPQGAEWKLGTMTYGAGDAGPTVEPATAWGAFGFGWRGTAGDPRDGAKIGRQVIEDGAGILDSMGWSWGLDNSLRLRTAHAGEGSLEEDDEAGSIESFDYGYGEGDELENMVRSSAAPVTFEAGESGRIASRNGVAFGYDGAGRRTTDDRFSYRWDWRGRLYEVTVASDAGTPYDGHQVRYEYDAVGRLLYRVHLGEEGVGGNRSFIEYRSYLWEGNGLLAEAGYGSNDGTWDDPETDLFLRWRKTYVPGASGLDDAVQVRVEIEEPADTSYPDTVYSYLRDELGTVMALVEEPYGEAAVAAEDIAYDSIAAASATLDGRFPGGQNCLFQGLWTDPVTGIAYARNRWYDARNASWLSEDSFGAVDSSNLYAFVGWGPNSFVDPLGEQSVRDALDWERDREQGRFFVGGMKELGYDIWNLATFGFLSKHDEAYEEFERTGDRQARSPNRTDGCIGRRRRSRRENGGRRGGSRNGRGSRKRRCKCRGDGCLRQVNRR